MTKYSKYNIVYRLQKWMDSVIGQTFLNYAYSWGASVVILGTLFKLTHLPGANLMLYIGMGTEVIVFFLSAFDRPFDKTAIGMDLSTQDSHPVTEVAPPLACDMTNKKETVAHGGIPLQVSEEMEEATGKYIDELKRLTEMISAVTEQSQRLTRDSEEMENLNRTLTGISRVYEMQLKSASSQMGTIDEINEQSRKMAGQIAELNKIYARMIEGLRN